MTEQAAGLSGWATDEEARRRWIAEEAMRRRQRSVITTLRASGIEAVAGYFGGVEIRVSDAEQVAALLAAQETSRLRDAIARMVRRAGSGDHAFEHYHDGDGWTEPFSDTYSCSCRHLLADWTQTDPQHTGRPDPADMLLAWRAHVIPVYDRCWCGGYIGPCPSGDTDGLGCLTDPAHDYQKPPAEAEDHPTHA